MARLLSGHGDGPRADIRAEGRERQAVSLSSAVATVAASLGETPRAQADAVARMAEGIPRARARLRPGRKHPRKSVKPASRRSRRRKAAA